MVRELREIRSALAASQRAEKASATAVPTAAKADKEVLGPVPKLRPIKDLRRKPFAFPTAEELVARFAYRGVSAEVRSETLRALRAKLPQLGTAMTQ